MRRRNLIEILLVEDNPGDASLALEVLGGARVLNRVHHVENGPDALRFLRREPPFAEVPLPHLVLLDLSLPGLDGRDVLARIKEDPKLKLIPVVVLTSSRTEADVNFCHDSHANCFISKPHETGELAAIVERIGRFWTEVATLPKH